MSLSLPTSLAFLRFHLQPVFRIGVIPPMFLPDVRGYRSALVGSDRVHPDPQRHLEDDRPPAATGPGDINPHCRTQDLCKALWPLISLAFSFA
jgi:hypothetical protein